MKFQKSEKDKSLGVENALSIIKDPARRQMICDRVPKIRVIPMNTMTPMVTIEGPPDDHSEQKYKDVIAARTVSTYPRYKINTLLCGQYNVMCFENRTLVR